LGRKAIAVKVVASNIDKVQRMVGKCIEQFGRLDILLNNAADFSVRSLSRLFEAEFGEK